MRLPWTLRAAVAIAEYCIRESKPPYQLVRHIDHDFTVEFGNICYDVGCTPLQLARLIQHAAEARAAANERRSADVARHTDAFQRLANELGLRDVTWTTSSLIPSYRDRSGDRRRIPCLPSRR